MKTLPILHSEFFPDLSNYRILLDTNFIIESNRHPTNFAELLSSLRSRSKELFTLEVIKKEFLYGIQTKTELNNLDNFLKQLVFNIDTNIGCFSKNLLTVTKLYRNYKKISLEDFIISCYLLEHKDSILLTKNHSDFPLRFFNRIGFIIAEYESEMQHYAFYQIDEMKINTLLKNFNKTP